MIKKQQQQKRRPAARSGALFVAVRGSYLPARPAAWLTYVPFVGYLVFSLIVGVRDMPSLPLGLMFVIPNWIATGAVMTYLAAHTS